ncbi:aminopeptidase [Chengkuizengella axinellae]|uniref:Aminopeptidase n=1 Tax=Chengkuizengella axinellae TaxID=3064388 RepID=A0ABT9IZN4_9BACL|nr:aminopeptidase [Chengkuizengella sp. 2205SS18-9]MDP5274775.1 aminopeptidase [Chengkuizengella sp. 2205SS18-9]
MTNFNENLQKYTDVILNIGVNIQKEQKLVISTDLRDAFFVRILTKKAYDLGASDVIVNWRDSIINRTKYDLAPLEAFEEFPRWIADGSTKLVEQGAAFLWIESEDPDLLKGVDTAKIAAHQKSAGQAFKKFSEYIQADKTSWNIVAAPSQAWAAKVFPDLPEEEQMEKLWESIFKISRVDQEDPIKAWKEHDEKLHYKANLLNEKKYKYLHYEAPGTKLTIELHEKHLWTGGSSVNEKGTSFFANMPTEEVFTIPLKTGVNGYVTNTKPLSYGGNLIDNFKITFENGRIIDFEAEQGYETLKALIDTDEGSHYLGEIALVPHHSPISNSNLIFYNTLFDENASNHLAIGSAYSFNLEGGTQMTREELDALGANDSITHEDFMIGSAEMNIDGETADGKREPLFRNGNWAF